MLNYTVELITATGFIVLLYGIYILVILSIPNIPLDEVTLFSF